MYGNAGASAGIDYTTVTDAAGSYSQSVPAGWSGTLSATDPVGGSLNPAMRSFEQMLKRDELAIVQGIGYPNPDRSHFESVEAFLWYYGPWHQILVALVQSWGLADPITVRHGFAGAVGPTRKREQLDFAERSRGAPPSLRHL